MSRAAGVRVGVVLAVAALGAAGLSGCDAAPGGGAGAKGAGAPASAVQCLGEVVGPRGASARFGPDRVSYAVPVMAPDACHFAAPEATTRWDGDRLVVSRSLARQAGICAQAMTRVVFEGEIRLPRRPLAALSAEVLGPGGEPVETVRFDRAAACR